MKFRNVILSKIQKMSQIEVIIMYSFHESGKLINIFDTLKLMYFILYLSNIS